MHNTQLVVWEHMCGRFLLLINIFDVCMMSEVVWKFFFCFCLHYSLLTVFVRRLCVLAVENLCTMHITSSCLGACVR